MDWTAALSHEVTTLVKLGLPLPASPSVTMNTSASIPSLDSALIS